MTNTEVTTLPFTVVEIALQEHTTVDFFSTDLQLLPLWLTVGFFIFFAGLLGMMYNYQSFLVTMMSVEVMYLGILTSFILYGVAFHDVKAAIYALLVLIFAACESAVGLGLLIAIYRFGQTIDFEGHQNLGG